MLLSACIYESSVAYGIPVSVIERVIAYGENSSNKKVQSGIGPMHIPSPWLPVLIAHGFHKKPLRYSPCWQVAAGTWILAVEKMDAADGNTVQMKTRMVYPTSIPAIPEQYIRYANEAAAATGVSPSILLAVAAQESGFNPGAVSPAGAEGLMQFIPATWEKYGRGSPFNARDAMFAGARYLRHLAIEFHSWRLAFAGYNAGGGAVRRWGGIPPYRQTQNYVPEVLTKYQQIVSAVR